MKLSAHQATVTKKKHLSPTVMMIQLKPHRPIRFKAGQHLVFPIPVGHTIVDRMFSIASPPFQEDSLELLIKLISGGVASTFFETIRTNTSFTFFGPRGNFQIRSHTRPMRFIASGTGIAPFRSMIYDLLGKKGITIPLHLTSIALQENEHLLQSEFRALSRTYNNFSYAPVTNLGQYFDKFTVAANEDIYLCGGPNFINDIIPMLVKRGAQDHRLHYEKFF